ncbi:MAG: 50S ribosomal protein L32, partial [Candidatus Dadabacteria bacterium]
HHIFKGIWGVVCPHCANFKLPHTVCMHCGYYNALLPVIKIREKKKNKSKDA